MGYPAFGGVVPGGAPNATEPAPTSSNEQQLDELKAQAEEFQDALDDIRKRIEEFEASNKKD